MKAEINKKILSSTSTVMFKKNKNVRTNFYSNEIKEWSKSYNNFYKKEFSKILKGW